MKKNYSVNRDGLCTKTNHSLILHEIFKSQPLRDSRQITFLIFNKFWSLNKNPLTPYPPHS